MCFRFVCVLFFAKVSGFSLVVLGTLMAVPDSSSRASVGVSIGIPQMLTLADGTFFPLVAGAIPWGRASRPASLAPETL
jgi:hypothetical protein